MEETDVTKKTLTEKVNERPVLFAGLLFVIIMIMIIVLFVKVNEAKKQAAETTSKLLSHVIIYHTDGEVDLSTQAFQPINMGLRAGRFNVSQYLDGVTVTGIILNPYANSMKESNFKLTIGDESKNFRIDMIGPGTAGYFSVFIPNTKTDQARYATLVYIDGKVLYRNM